MIYPIICFTISLKVMMCEKMFNVYFVRNSIICWHKFRNAVAPFIPAMPIEKYYVTCNAFMKRKLGQNAATILRSFRSS